MPLPVPTSKAVDEGKITIISPGVRRHRRRMFRFMNHIMIPGYAPICCDSNDPFTVECGLKKRLCRDLPVPDVEILLRFKQFVRDYLEAKVGHSQPLEFEEWLATTSYTVKRKQELRLTYERLRGGTPNHLQRRKVKTFVKTEFYAMLKHCRTINSRCDAVKVFMGPRAKAIEQVVYKCEAFIKHTPTKERPAKLLSLKKDGRRYFLSDYTAFESHFISTFMHICECELYRWVLDTDEEVETMCDIMKGWATLVTSTGLLCTIKGRRMSGEMTTSVGNGFSNLMLATFIAHWRNGDLNPSHGPFLHGYVEGDDGIFAVDCEIKASDFEKLGFTCKLVEVNDPCECLPVEPVEGEDERFGRHAGAFCGVCCTDQGEIIRDPRAFAAGFGWTSSFIHGRQALMDELSLAKALSTLFETPQCPIVAVMARYVMERTRHAHPRFVDDGYHAHQTLTVESKFERFSPSAETRALFSSHFGIPANVQLMIEELISRGDFAGVAELMPPSPDMLWYSTRFVEAG